jgi:hypothetical protein
MTNVQAATIPGVPGQPNEDAYAVLPTLMVVADGATSPPRLGDGCRHGPGWYARRLVANVVAAHVEDLGAAGVYVLAEAIDRTTAAHADTCDLTHPGTPSATVTMLLPDEHAGAGWVVLGDATLVLDTGDDLRVISDDRLSNSSAPERAAVLAGGAALSREEHGRQVAALVDSQRRYRNRPGGFWVAATDPHAAHHALTGRAPFSPPGGLCRAALLTDGATRAVDTYGLMSWPTALDLMTANGPTALLDAVRAAEDDDPEGAAFPRMKRSDDATAVLVSWPTDQP